MNSECLRIADQVRRAFAGKAWHGPSLKKLLAGATAEQAQARPITHAHSIWELVLHIEAWTRAALEAVNGAAIPIMLPPEKDWPPVTGSSEEAWAGAVGHMFGTMEQLALAVEKFQDARLTESVPGRKYDFYYLFHGIVQHSLYHAGQIALLKKAALPPVDPVARAG
jgi:hypothetical protein